LRSLMVVERMLLPTLPQVTWRKVSFGNATMYSLVTLFGSYHFRSTWKLCYFHNQLQSILLNRPSTPFIPLSYDHISRSNGHHGSVILGIFILAVHWSRSILCGFQVQVHGVNCSDMLQSHLLSMCCHHDSPALFISGVEKRWFHIERSCLCCWLSILF